jgi:hypothetical protein
MLRNFIVTGITMGLFATEMPAQRAVEFEGRYWIPRFTSRFRVDSNRLGTDVDGKQDLAFPDTNFPEGRFTFQGKGRSRLSFSYTPIDYSGGGTITRSVLFHGQQYTVGTRVLSGLEVQHLQLSWTYQFIQVKDGLFKLGPLVEGNGFLMHGRLRAPNLTPAIDQREDLSVGLPTVGLAMDINPHRMVNLSGTVSGLKAGDYGQFINSSAAVKVRPVENLFFTAGYRTFNLSAQSSPVFVTLHLRGPFVGGGIRF